MRTLLILGGLVVCLLLVTPSNGDRTESQDRGGEKGTSDLREFIGQNENGKANRIDAGSSSTIDQQVQLRPRRQEPSSSKRPRKKKKCNGCFSSLSIEDPIKLDLSKRTRREDKQPEKKNSRKPKLPNMYSLTTRSIRMKRDKKSKPSKKSLSLSDKDRSKRRSKSRKRDKKRKSSKKSSLPDTDRLEGKPELDRPATRERKIEQPRPHMFALMSVRPPDFSTHEKPPNDEGRKERKKNDRNRRREEKKERKMRKHHPHHPHHPHHHHHPEGEKEEYKGRRTGSRSPITSTYGGIWDDLSDGKGVAERMKRQSDNGKRRKDQKDRWRSGSRSAVASLPTLRF